MEDFSMRNTHSEIIIAGDFRYFADGIPNDHECDSKGDVHYWTASGKHVTWHTQRQWAHLTTQAREPLLYAYYERIGDPICSGSVSCSICKQSALNQAAWL